MVKKITATKKKEQLHITPFLEAVTLGRRGWNLEGINFYYGKWKAHYSVDASNEEKEIFLDHLWVLIRAILVGNELISQVDIVDIITDIGDEVRSLTDLLDWNILEPGS